MKWNHTKFGNWFWRNYWYRVSWYIGDRKFAKWVRYGKDHGCFLKFENWEQLHDWENKMLSTYENPRRTNILNIFKSYDKWPK